MFFSIFSINSSILSSVSSHSSAICVMFFPFSSFFLSVCIVLPPCLPYDPFHIFHPISFPTSYNFPSILCHRAFPAHDAEVYECIHPLAGSYSDNPVNLPDWFAALHVLRRKRYTSYSSIGISFTAFPQKPITARTSKEKDNGNPNIKLWFTCFVMKTCIPANAPITPKTAAIRRGSFRDSPLV